MKRYILRRVVTGKYYVGRNGTQWGARIEAKSYSRVRDAKVARNRIVANAKAWWNQGWAIEVLELNTDGSVSPI